MKINKPKTNERLSENALQELRVAPMEPLLLPCYREMADAFVRQKGRCTFEELETEVRRHFEAAAVRSYSSCVGECLNRLSLSQRDIAAAVGVVESTVSKWINEGRMSFWSWVKLLLALNLRVGDFRFPNSDEALFRAYSAALAGVAQRLYGEDARKELQRREYELLKQWCKSSSWLAAVSTPNQELRERMMKDAARTIFKEVIASFPMRDSFTTSEVKATAESWGVVWCVTILSIPYNWPVINGRASL